MSILTVAVENELLTRAHMLAADRGTTVDQMVLAFLESEVRAAAGQRLLSRRYAIGAIDWTRDDLYQREV